MVVHAKRKRPMLALDLAPPWKLVLQDVVLPAYAGESSVASLVRHLLQDFIGCFVTESEMRIRGLLPPHMSLGRPDVMLFALRRAEELRREMDVGPTGEVVRHKTAKHGSGRSG